MRRRGLQPAEPLPLALGLFDKAGHPLPTQRRSSWARLLEWLENDEALLAFAFPEGLATVDQVVCRNDLAILRKQPWSPQAGVRALLKGWPTFQEKRTLTLEASEQRLFEACQKDLAELEAKPKKKRRL